MRAIMTCLLLEDVSRRVTYAIACITMQERAMVDKISMCVATFSLYVHFSIGPRIRKSVVWTKCSLSLTSSRICPCESELVLATHMREAIQGIATCRPTRTKNRTRCRLDGGCRHTQNMLVGQFGLLFLACVMEASRVEHSERYVVGCWWPLPRCVRIRRHPFRIAAVQTNMRTRSKYTWKTNTIRNLWWMKNRV